MKKNKLFYIIKILSFSVITVLLAAIPVSVSAAEHQYVYFGSYPQTEVVDAPEHSGTYNKFWASSEDFISDKSLYTELSRAIWNSSGEYSASDGHKYRRIKKSDATCPNMGIDSARDLQFNWEDDTTYHYFRYEPIRWRVLREENDTMFLFADLALDDIPFNVEFGPVTWENSTSRYWLNNDFYQTAFNELEKRSILVTHNTNQPLPQFSDVDAGSDTQDKLFLLTYGDISGDEGLANGFSVSSSKSNCPERNKASSTYAKARGVRTYETEYGDYACDWWIRTHGMEAYSAIAVFPGGSMTPLGSNNNHTDYGMSPAMWVKKPLESQHSYEPYSVPAGLLKDGYKCKRCSICGHITSKQIVRGYSKLYAKSVKLVSGKKKITVKWGKRSKSIQKNFSRYQIRYSTSKNFKSYKNVYAKKSSSYKAISKLKPRKAYYVKVRTYTVRNGKRYYSKWTSVKRIKTK